MFLKKILTLGLVILAYLPFPLMACTMQTEIKTAITPVTLELVKKTIKLAKKNECSSILLEIDTPGGALNATRLIVQEILNSPTPFLCLVSPKGGQATSAGAIILQACHVNGALRGTNLGASTPIMMGKQMEKESDLRKKAVNDTVSFVQSLSRLRKTKRYIRQRDSHPSQIRNRRGSLNPKSHRLEWRYHKRVSRVFKKSRGRDEKRG